MIEVDSKVINYILRGERGGILESFFYDSSSSYQWRWTDYHFHTFEEMKAMIICSYNGDCEHNRAIIYEMEQPETSI